MPIEFSHCQTPAGVPYLRADVSDKVELDQAQTIGERLRDPAASQVHGGRVLSVVAKGTVYSPQARKYFNTITHDYVGMAVVVTSALVRAAINMMMRLVPNPGNARIFNDEDQAIAWLEEQIPRT